MSGAAADPRARPFAEAREQEALLERCRALARSAAEVGVDEHEAYGERGESIAVRFEKGDMKLTQVDDGSTLGLRVFAGRRLGFSSTNQSDDEALARTARDALTLAHINPPDDANRLPAAADPAPPLALATPGIAELEVEEVVALGRRLVDRVRGADARISIDQAHVTVRRGARAIVNSLGVERAETDALLDFVVFGMAVDGADVGGFHYCGDGVRSAGEIDAAIERCAGEFTEAVLGNLGARAAESYRGRVLFAPEAFLEVFIAPLFQAASAIAVQRGRSALCGRLGERIGSADLTVLDDPSDGTLRGAGSFDREGQPARPYDVVRAGCLRGLLYNGYAANVEGRTSTGHACGAARSLPGLGPHAVRVEPGSGGELGELMQQLDRGLLVRRFSGTVDPASGDFSGVAKSARWIEGGRIVRPLRETLVSGNAFELLARIEALSSRVERVMGAAAVPWALVDGVSVTAG